ncbi:hypothetical protein Aperf_G00000009301 [Anoplocephala perfoliata]
MKCLDEVLSFLGWTTESLENLPGMQVCPLDKGHLMPVDRVENHVGRCRLRLQGYTKSQIKAFWSYSDDEIRKFSGSALRSGGVKLPENFIFNPSSSQSLVNSSAQDRGEKKSTDHERAFMRDLKRRRQSYRGIHTAKKSYIEILREVIEHHTALLSGSAGSNPVDDSLRDVQSEAYTLKSSDRRSRNPSTSVEDRSEPKQSSIKLPMHSKSRHRSRHADRSD